ncbi:hypothetical protein [Enterobacter cancerogenus]
MTGERFADPWPERSLTVRSGADVVRLRPANLARDQKAIAARQDDGSVVAWGNSSRGGDAPDLMGRISYQLPDRARVRRLAKTSKLSS